MTKTVLVTGGIGFLGRAVAHKYKQLGYRVVGIGRGHWVGDDLSDSGFDVWTDSNITMSSLLGLQESFDLIVHCGGSGSVGYSLTNPFDDFSKTVQGTINLLEFLRITESKALLVYPSSAGVYGAKNDSPIKESDALNPISPYGFHKRIAEDIIESYSKNYGIRAVIVRFFSIYGPGMNKQLLWDACIKLRNVGNEEVVFWGTGKETRDWIYIDDAVELINVATMSPLYFTLVNGGSGVRTTVYDTLNLLNTALGSTAKIIFNQTIRPGDPIFYHANIKAIKSMGWKPNTSLQEGICSYVAWFQKLKHE